MAIIYQNSNLIFATFFTTYKDLCFNYTVKYTYLIIHLITLEVELDASFNSLFPIIKKKMLKFIMNSCRSVLIHHAFTYVVGVFKNLISLRMIWNFYLN